MRNRVLQTCFSTAWGGLEMVAFELAERMEHNGFSITTACTPNSPLSQRLQEAGLSVLAVRREHKYWSPQVTLALRREIQSGGYSAVLVEQLNELWQVVPSLWFLPHVQLVGISHTLVGIAKKDALHRHLYARLNHLVALTSIHKQNLVMNLPVRENIVEVLPNAVDLARFNPDRRSESWRTQILGPQNVPLIGVISRIDQGKGLREVLQAAARAHREGSHFKMVVVGKETIGEEGMLDVLRDDIQKLGLTEVVELLGHRSDVETVVASLDILIMPSPNETFGRVLIEAMASRVAVIASSGGGVTDIIRHGVDGLLSPPLDVEVTAAEIKRLVTDPSLRLQLAAGGYKAAQDRYDQKYLDQKLYQLLGLVEDRKISPV